MVSLLKVWEITKLPIGPRVLGGEVPHVVFPTLCHPPPLSIPCVLLLCEELVLLGTDLSNQTRPLHTLFLLLLYFAFVFTLHLLSTACKISPFINP